MDLSALGAVVRAERGATARGWPSASVVLGGTVVSLIGMTWDIQWHSDVGPDTFFTVPHLFLYAGSAISGIASLVVVLATTAAKRAGRPVDETVGGKAIGVFGRTFSAPLGYLVSGIGAASFLLYGLWDQWWHSLYGFDAVISSPPHIGLLLSITVTVLGSMMIFAAAREKPWGTTGTFASVVVLLSFCAVTALGLEELRGTINWVTVATGFFSVMLVLLTAAFTGRPGGAVVVAVGLGVVQAVFWWFSPWAARAYADAVGLPVRDYAQGIPELPSLMPMCLLLVALVAEVVPWLAARRGSVPGWLPLVAGGVGGLIVTACAPVQNSIVFGSRMPAAGALVATCVAGAVSGLLAGFLGVRFGRMLRLLAPSTSGGQ